MARETAAQREAREFNEMAAGMGKNSKLEIIDDETGDVRYTLQYNRITVKKMARDGFKIESIDDSDIIGSMSALEDLICGAFEMHHPSMTADERLDAWEECVPDKGEGVRMLTALYIAPIQALSKNPTTVTTRMRLA